MGFSLDFWNCSTFCKAPKVAVIVSINCLIVHTGIDIFFITNDHVMMVISEFYENEFGV